MTTSKRFQIVVGYDFSPQAGLALDRAIWLASGFTDADVHVVAALIGNVTNPYFPQVGKNIDGADSVRARLATTIEKRTAALKTAFVHTYAHAWLETGGDSIIGVANDVRADLIIVGTHSKRGIARAVLGSISEKVVREARCPVMVIRETTWDQQETAAQLEPPCSHCIETRQRSNGETWWCEFHDHAPPYRSPLRSRAKIDPEQSRRMAWPMY